MVVPLMMLHYLFVKVFVVIYLCLYTPPQPITLVVLQHCNLQENPDFAPPPSYILLCSPRIDEIDDS